jgi:branched-chain amino acid aminotransferase
MRMTIPYSRAEVRAILHGCVRRRPARRLRRDGVHARRAAAGSRDRASRRTASTPTRCRSSGSRRPTSSARASTCTSASALRIAPESVDPTIKNYHWLDLVLSLFDAYDRGADTSCVVDADGNVAEGPGFNVFMVKDGVVRTPERGVLEGISRRTVIELCGALAIPLSVAPVPATDLAGRRRSVPQLDRRRRAADRQDRRPAARRRSRPGR